MICPKRRFPSHLSASGRAPKVPRLRHAVAGSPTHPAEAGSLSYRLLVRLQLLPTPPRGDAVTLSYAWRDYHAAGTCTLLTQRPHDRRPPAGSSNVGTVEARAGRRPGGPTEHQGTTTPRRRSPSISQRQGA